uniref:Uncharacterized protein n=1 Tax=Pyxicephalus adspersus TaxID=30357 RepID=A0AAV3AK37_PYXAD|nr:TPA: hypothetical protein GDO54_012395 [Pyxicephalus adspersus]
MLTIFYFANILIEIVNERQTIQPLHKSHANCTELKLSQAHNLQSLVGSISSFNFRITFIKFKFSAHFLKPS